MKRKAGSTLRISGSHAQLETQLVKLGGLPSNLAFVKLYRKYPSYDPKLSWLPVCPLRLVLQPYQADLTDQLSTPQLNWLMCSVEHNEIKNVLVRARAQRLLKGDVCANMDSDYEVTSVEYKLVALPHESKLYAIYEFANNPLFEWLSFVENAKERGMEYHAQVLRGLLLCCCGSHDTKFDDETMNLYSVHRYMKRKGKSLDEDSDDVQMLQQAGWSERLCDDEWAQVARLLPSDALTYKDAIKAAHMGLFDVVQNSNLMQEQLHHALKILFSGSGEDYLATQLLAYCAECGYRFESLTLLQGVMNRVQLSPKSIQELIAVFEPRPVKLKLLELSEDLKAGVYQSLHEINNLPYGIILRTFALKLIVQEHYKVGLAEETRFVFEYALKNNHLPTLKRLIDDVRIDHLNPDLLYEMSAEICAWLLETGWLVVTRGAIETRNMRPLTLVVALLKPEVIVYLVKASLLKVGEIGDNELAMQLCSDGDFARALGSEADAEFALSGTHWSFEHWARPNGAQMDLLKKMNCKALLAWTQDPILQRHLTDKTYFGQ